MPFVSLSWIFVPPFSNVIHRCPFALQHPWSNGPVEGHVHRLKLIKRSMYGRAKFDLLRLRVVNAE